MAQINRLRSGECIFTLAEWAVIYGCEPKPYYKPTEPTLFKVYTLPEFLIPIDSRWELFHLTDYVVSSVTAGTIWLVERNTAESLPC